MKNNKKRKIKAVIFDIGGVLILPRKPIKVKKGVKIAGVHQEMANKFKISLDQWFDSLDTAYAEAIEGKISKNKTLKIISKNLNANPKKFEKLFFKTYRKKFKQNKELYKIAFKLKKQKYKIAILSDQWYISKEALMPKKYTKKFNVVVLSCDVGFRKPDIRIYKLTLKKLKLKPNQVIFIDDRKWNTDTAKKLGMNTVLFKNNKQLIKELRNFGIYAK